jgi:hypothetical protein
LAMPAGFWNFKIAMGNTRSGPAPPHAAPASHYSGSATGRRNR